MIAMITSLLALWALLVVTFFSALGFLARPPIPPADLMQQDGISGGQRQDE